MALACLGLCVPRALAVEEFLTVVIGSDQTIRDVAEQYLSDPDLWPEILRSSGVRSIAELRPGMELRVPVTEISTANQALLEALGQIQKANAAGAQIFAPEEIGEAVDLHEQALQQRLAREWTRTKELALASFSGAVSAFDKSVATRDQTAEALVSDRIGSVEGQRPEDLSWRDLALRAVLIEEEKIRTLSDSTAQITFRDSSRLRLNANSNAIIKEMRFDPLYKTQEAKVSLVEGDFSALLTGSNDRTKFNVEVPQVNAVIDSGDFWVSNDADGAKFANYDEKVVRVAANGETVTLGKNEGTTVSKGERPKAVAVLPPPTLVTPVDNGAVYVTGPELSWSSVAGSAGYWLEVAGDQRFDHIVANHFGIEDARKVVDRLPVGEYFWRVSALDQFGLPGERSQARRFTVAPDETPPYLKIDAPGEGVILRNVSVEVIGESEPGATLTVAGSAVEIAPLGTFTATITATVGENIVVIVATDPAGNKTNAERHFTYMPDVQSAVVFDFSLKQVGPLHFLANGNVLSLSGRTTVGATFEVRSGNTVRASAVADHGGVFHINVPLVADEEKLAFAVIAPSGFSTTGEFAATIDRSPPEIALDDILPRLTAEEVLRVAGRTDPDAKLALNGHPIAVKAGAFDVTVNLKAGENIIELVATDPVGNVQIEKSEVKLDLQAPTLVSSAATISTSGGKPMLGLEVVATDASGLAKAAPFTVIAGDQSYRGYLRYNRAAKKYQGIVFVPEAEIAHARLSRVELEDDAGNRQVFDIK